MVNNCTYTIFVVDDEPLNLKMLSRFLENDLYTIVTFESGLDMLDYMENREVPDLVLLDIMMPEIDGFTLCSKIRNKYSAFEVPILFLTVKNELSNIIDGFSTGGNDYLTKPIAKKMLLERVENQIDLIKFRKKFVSVYVSENWKSDNKDTDSLVNNIFDVISKEPNASSICLFESGELQRSYGDNEALILENKKWNQVDEVVNTREAMFIFLKLNKEGTTVIGIHYKHPIKTFDMEYYNNMIETAEKLRGGISEITKNSETLHDLYKISEHKKKIICVKSENGNVLLFTEKNKNGTILFTRLKTIKMYFDDDTLLQIHRSYLINPNKVVSVSKEYVGIKKNVKYSVHIDGQEDLCIGKSFVPKVQQTYPHWFKD